MTYLSILKPRIKAGELYNLIFKYKGIYNKQNTKLTNSNSFIVYNNKNNSNSKNKGDQCAQKFKAKLYLLLTFKMLPFAGHLEK